MANIITVPPSPQPWEMLSGVISQFTDRYTKNRQEQEAMELQRQQLAQTGKYQDRMAGVSEGQLNVAQEAQRLASDQQAYAQAKERWGAAYDQAIAPMLASGRPEDFQAAQANIKALVQAHPEFAAYAGATALRLQNGPLPTDTANAQANQYDLTQTTRANTSADPNAANYATRRNLKADMPAYAFAQQQATDLQARGGGSASPIPRPTGNAVTDYERRATEGMPTAAQNLGAQTQITTTGMQEAGATKRAGMAAAAKNAAPPTIEAGTPLYGVAQDLSSGHLTFEQFTKLYGRGANPLKQAIYQTAKQINPDFDPSSFELGYKFAGNKGVRQQVAAADNALRMIPEAISISDKATRLGPTGLNKLIMSGGVMLGGKKYTDAQTLQKAFGDEISGALGFGGATDMTRELGLSMADLNFSSGNFRSAMEILDTFLKNKRGTLVNQMGQYGGTVDKFSGGNSSGKGNPLGLTPPK